MHHNLSKDVPKFDIELLFDEIGVLLDDNQYRDAISLVDMYHFYTRRHQVSVYFLFLLITVSADKIHALPALPYPLSRFISSHMIPIRSHLFDPTSTTLPACPTHRLGQPIFFAPFVDILVPPVTVPFPVPHLNFDTNTRTSRNRLSLQIDVSALTSIGNTDQLLKF